MRFFRQFLTSYILCALSWLAGSGAAEAQSWQAALALPTGANESSSITKVVADGSGGYVIAGYFTGTVTLGSFTLTSAGGQDAFVARLSSFGVYSQAVRVGSTGDERITALALDAAGNVFVGGNFTSPTLAVGSVTLANSGTDNDLFVARLSSAGQWTQAVQAGGPSYDTLTGLGLDPNGSVVVVGSFAGGSIAFGGLTVQSKSTSGALFVARLSAAGTWAQALTATSNGVPNSASSVAVDANGSAWVYGTCLDSGTLTFGNFTLTTTTGMAVFVARLNRTGTWVQFSKGVSAARVVYSADIVLDKAGNAVVTGNFRKADVSFGNYTLLYNGQDYDNLYVARLTSAGTWTQAAQAAGSTYHSASTLALDANDNVLVTGTFRSPSITFGATTLTNSGPTTGSNPTANIFLARLTATGTWAYAAQAGGVGNDFPLSLAADGASVVVAGNFESASASFGGLSITSSANRAGFLARTGSVLSVATAAGQGLARLSCAPNPAGAGATVVSLPAEAVARPLQLFDALGRQVRAFELPAHTSILPLRLAGLPSGVYTLRCGASSSRLAIE